MSGGQHAWQGIFYVVLVTVFVTNVFCLVYFAARGSHITDFVEPQNLFSLSLNSPRSAVLDGSCGSGPAGEQYKVSWRISHDQEQDHLYIESKGVQRGVRKRKFWQDKNFEMKSGPMSSVKSKLGGTSRL